MSPTIAAAVVDVNAQTGFVVRVSDAGGCWETGGPVWLFDATLLCGMVALVAVLWWVESWSSRDPGRKQTAGERLRQAVPAGSLLLVMAISGGFAVLDAIALILVATVLLGTALVVAVAQRRRRALSGGTELTTLWSLADRTVRWGRRPSPVCPSSVPQGLSGFRLPPATPADFGPTLAAPRTSGHRQIR